MWEKTQRPDLHRRWDLRFTRIHFRPRSEGSDPQHFLYATRLGFGLEIRGEGETVGDRNGRDDSRTSALRFRSEDPRSLILEGSGYWRYVPTDDGVRF